jgi:hypothetical protein
MSQIIESKDIESATTALECVLNPFRRDNELELATDNNQTQKRADMIVSFGATTPCPMPSTN